MKSHHLVGATCLLLIATSWAQAEDPTLKPAAAPAADSETPAPSAIPAVLDFKMKKLEGGTIHLAKTYANRVVLLVNVASKCGLTGQYEQLQALHKKYARQGLAVVGVPCNQFLKQEPGTAKQIREFCSNNYGVQFDLLAKVDVNGESACGLYRYLTGKETNAPYAGPIRWNFEKFLISRSGNVVARFHPKVKPDDDKVIAAIERELAVQLKAKKGN
jgi:glutathione peroxidase